MDFSSGILLRHCKDLPMGLLRGLHYHQIVQNPVFKRILWEWVMKSVRTFWGYKQSCTGIVFQLLQFRKTALCTIPQMVDWQLTKSCQSSLTVLQSTSLSGILLHYTYPSWSGAGLHFNFFIPWKLAPSVWGCQGSSSTIMPCLEHPQV